MKYYRNEIILSNKLSEHKRLVTTGLILLLDSWAKFELNKVT